MLSFSLAGLMSCVLRGLKCFSNLHFTSVQSVKVMKTWQGDTGGPISLNHPLYIKESFYSCSGICCQSLLDGKNSNCNVHYFYTLKNGFKSICTASKFHKEKTTLNNTLN